MPFLPGLLGHLGLRKFGGQVGRDISDIVLGGQLIVAGFVTGHPELSELGFGLLNSKIRGEDSPGLAAAQGAILRNRLNPKAPVPLVYGTAKLGVIIADIAVDGASSNNEDLYVPTVICHGSRDDLGIASIGKIFFNNQLAINAAEAFQDPYVFLINLDFTKYLGTSTQNIADLLIGVSDLDTVFSEWDKTTDDGRGLAGVMFRLKWDRDVYPMALPTFNMEVKGNFIEDTRSEVSGVNLTFADADPDTIVRASGSFTTDGYVAGDRVAVSGSSNNDGSYTIATVAALTLTLVAGDVLAAEGPAGSITLKRWAHPDNGGDNPAMVLRDYLLSSTYGAGAHVTSTMIDDTSFEAMANHCDDSISNPAGSANRFTVNGWLSTGRTVRQNIETILASMRASLIPQGATLHLFIPRVVSPSSITLNADNILGDWDFTVPGADSKINMIRVTYIDPDKEFQADVVQWPEPGATNPYLTADGGLTQERSLDLPLTQNVYTAQQIGMTLLKESRHGIVVGLTANQTALQLEIGDVVKVTHDTPSWTDKLFWVAAITILPDTNVRLTLVEYEISVTDDMTFADAGPDTITRASGSWITDGFVAYDQVNVSGSASNDGTYIVASVAATVLTLDAAETLANEGPVSCTVKTSIYGLDTQSTALADVGDNLPRNPNDIDDPTNVSLAGTTAEGFTTATGQYVARIKITLTDADDAFVDGYDVEAKRNTDTNYDNYGFFHFGDVEFFVTPVTEGEQWDVRVRSVNKATGVTGDWVTTNVTPGYPSGSGTTAITDGWSGAQNAAAPENGDESIGADGSVAYSNLEDANGIVTTYTAYYDINTLSMGGANLVTVFLYTNDAAGSTNWTARASNSYDNTSNVTDETLSVEIAMGADFDLRVVVTYSQTPDPAELAQVEMHGEDHGTEAGVQYDKITTGIVGGTIPASDVTSGGTLIDAAVASSNVTQHEAAIDHDALTNFVSGEHFLQSAITGLGTQVQTLDMGTNGITNAGDITASGEFISTGGGETGKFFTGGAGNTVFSFSGGNFDIRAGDGMSSSQNVMRVTFAGAFDFQGGNVSNVGTYSGGAITAAAGTFSGLLQNTGGAKLEIQNAVDGGNSRGIFMWSSTNANWGIYMGTPGASKSLSGGTAVAGDGFTSHAIRFRTDLSATNGFIWENSVELRLMSLRGSDGFLSVAGPLTSGGLLQTVATASGGAGLNLPHGTAPSSPVDGDRWTDTVAGFDRINGVTKQIHYVGGDLTALGVNSDDTPVAGAMHFKERASDPGDPTEGNAVIWMSDGTAAGDDGDVMIKTKAGGVVKTGTLFDHSAA